MDANMRYVYRTVNGKLTDAHSQEMRLQYRIMLDTLADRIRHRLDRLGKTARAASLEAGLSDAFIRNILTHKSTNPRSDTIGQIAAVLKTTVPWLQHGEGPEELDQEEATTIGVPMMGYIGAGAEILPDFEQVPPEGLYTVDLPFAVPPGLIGFEIKGDSMLPRYDEGDVILVYAQQQRAADNFLGEEVAVRTGDERRYLKRLMRGQLPGHFNLESWNARTIENVRLHWIGEIYLTVRSGQLRRIAQRERANATRQRNIRAAETRGMDELPLDVASKRKPM
ncbi:S24 family peptidase [Labrys portucalensis]|uniref:S24 family peptidase n=1 Tax=Labrys neptuniae TaxID=376174 RepID=A0ABV6Z8V5_9HYPH